MINTLHVNGPFGTPDSLKFLGLKRERRRRESYLRAHPDLLRVQSVYLSNCITITITITSNLLLKTTHSFLELIIFSLF